MEHHEHHLGCCGYDELVDKPATTRPLTDARRIPTVKIEPKKTDGPMVTRRIGMGSSQAPARYRVVNLGR